MDEISSKDVHEDELNEGEGKSDAGKIDESFSKELKEAYNDEEGDVTDEGKGLEDRENPESPEGPEHITCINEKLEGSVHPDTGVPFESRVIEKDGKEYEVVVPCFDSKFEAQLPEDLYQASNKKQFEECNGQVLDAIEEYPSIRKEFTEEELDQFEDGETPDGYTWHHDAETGRMQLVDSDIHNRTAHTGGQYFWGGGTENR